jgi:hypothetical protein
MNVLNDTTVELPAEVMRTGQKVKHTFDGVFDGLSTQHTIFDNVAKPIIEGVMEGYNGTILAYG